LARLGTPDAIRLEHEGHREDSVDELPTHELASVILPKLSFMCR
jgi:hypothetical protein